MENTDFIKRISFQLFEIITELNDEKSETNKKEISKKLKKIDSELLKKFNVKLSDKDKKNAVELIKILK